MKQIGFIYLLCVLFNIGQLATSWLKFDQSSYRNYQMVVFFTINMILIFSLLDYMLQFVCAQSPYNMRGLLLGFATFLNSLSLIVAFILSFAFWWACHKNYCVIIQNSLTVSLSIVGFAFYYLLVHWYNMRVRNEDYNVYKVVEEVYDRYLSQRSGPP